MDLVAVYEHNGIEVALAEKEVCCGMPKLELGDLDAVVRAKEINIPVLAAWVDKGWDIVTPIPSCTLMFKQELPLMFPDDEGVKKVQSAMFDPFEYLMLRHKDGKLKTEFAQPLGKVSYQVPCHLRVQNIGLKTRDVLQLVPDTTVEAIERCSGHDGTYAVKKEFHDISKKIARPVVNKVKKERRRPFRQRLPDGGRPDCAGPRRILRRPPHEPAQESLRNMNAMQKLTRDDLYSLEQYSEIRDEFRNQVLAHKRNRRVELGTNAALYFEDRLTMQYQVQEMLRIERIFEAAGINDELEAYNPLIPDGSNWKATFMVEFPDVEERRAMLNRLVGIEDKVYVQVEGFDRVYAIADEDLERSDEKKTSAVHFLRFELSAEEVDALKSGASLAAGIDHENYQVEIAPLPENIRQSLLGDLE